MPLEVCQLFISISRLHFKYNWYYKFSFHLYLSSCYCFAVVRYGPFPSGSYLTICSHYLLLQLQIWWHKSLVNHQMFKNYNLYFSLCFTLCDLGPYFYCMSYFHNGMLRLRHSIIAFFDNVLRFFTTLQLFCKHPWFCSKLKCLNPLSSVICQWKTE